MDRWRPRGGNSKNFATGELEAGVSCYALYWDLTGQCYKHTGGGLEGAMILYAIQGAPKYLITGTECGVGSDGEPLLKNVEVLGEMIFDTNKDGYVLKDEKIIRTKPPKPRRKRKK